MIRRLPGRTGQAGQIAGKRVSIDIVEHGILGQDVTRGPSTSTR